MTTEIFHIGYDNTFIRILKEDGVAVDLSSVTRVTIEINDTIYDSANNGGVDSGSMFDCSTGDGKIVFALGNIDDPPAIGKHKAEIVTYDPTNDDGIVWPIFGITVR